jgi:hypothetical protein
VTYDVIIPLKHTISATDDISGHVSENGGMCHFVTLHCEIAALLVEKVHLWWHLAFHAPFTTLEGVNDIIYIIYI